MKKITWLSKLVVDKFDRDAIHKMIWRAFPGQPVGSKSPFLFRVEENHVLVRSMVKPQWDDETVQVRPERHIWETGDEAFVSVHMSPFRRRSAKEIPSTKDQDLEWITGRLSRAGLSLSSSVIEDDLESHSTSISVRRLFVDYSVNKRCPLNPLTIEATVEVTDEIALDRAISEGIGGRKQFLGFGMLILT